MSNSFIDSPYEQRCIKCGINYGRVHKPRYKGESLFCSRCGAKLEVYLK